MMSVIGPIVLILAFCSGVFALAKLLELPFTADWPAFWRWVQSKRKKG